MGVGYAAKDIDTVQCALLVVSLVGWELLGVMIFLQEIACRENG